MAAPLSTTPSATSLQPTLPRLLHRWPWPAVCTWSGAWLAAALAARAGLEHGLHHLLGAAMAVAAALSWPRLGRGRRLWLALGYPMLVALLDQAALPAWAWLVPLGVLLALYPMRAWRDAPLFPTPPRALRGLAARTPLPAQARVLDAGCGIGDGLRALRREYPHARIEGIERSRLLALVARWRARPCGVSSADMWAVSWAGFDLVYLFQRPESMARAWQKAHSEMRPGAWLVSLEFEVPGQPPQAVLRRSQRRCVWIYRMPGSGEAASATATAALPAAKKSPDPAAVVRSRQRRQRR